MTPTTKFGELKNKRHARMLGRTEKKREAPHKACMHCHEIQPNGTRVCPSCGNEHFPKRTRNSPFYGVKTEDRPPARDPRYTK